MECSLPSTSNAYVIATQTGSLPMGGTVPDTPIYALRQLPDGLLATAAASAPPVRKEIDIGGQLAFLIDNILSPQACRTLIGIGEQLGFRDAAPGITTPPGMRMNQALHCMVDAELLALIHQRIAPLLPPSLHGKALWPKLSQRINLYKYRNGDVFNRHTDGDWPGYGFSSDQVSIEEWPGGRSQLSMLLYLNGPQDGVQGGATRLYGATGALADVVPQAGSALFFQHGFGPGSVIHAGTKVSGDIAKYVARINVLYDRV